MPKIDKLVILALAFALTLPVVLVNSTILAKASPPITPIDPFTLSGAYDKTSTFGEFLGQEIQAPAEPAEAQKVAQVLGTNDLPKRIEVDLSTQRLYAYEGDRIVYSFLISSGKYGRTPTGTFRIWGKFRYTKMEGGSKEKGTYYYLPNVPFVMFFSNEEIAAARGFSIHGTYWHNNFGTPMSHGCINMKTSEVEQLYYWAQPNLGDKKSGRATADNPGTEVIIYGKAP